MENNRIRNQDFSIIDEFLIFVSIIVFLPPSRPWLGGSGIVDIIGVRF